MQTNRFAINEYDPVDTLGDVLPYQIRQLDDCLRKSEYYDLERIQRGCIRPELAWCLQITILMALIVLQAVFLAKVISWLVTFTTIASIFISVIVVGFLGHCMKKSLTKYIAKRLILRGRDFEDRVQEFSQYHGWMSGITFSFGTFGSYIKMEYGDIYKDKSERKIEHSFRTYQQIRPINYLH